MTVVLPPNPYVGPRSFQIGERLYGRDRELAELLDLLIAERIVLLYSPSGAGKSSLIQAGLVPLLQQEGFDILPVMRVSAEPPPFLAGAGQHPATNADGSARPLVEHGNGNANVGQADGYAHGEAFPDPGAPAGASTAAPFAPNRYSLSALLALEERLPVDQRSTPAVLAGLTLDSCLKTLPGMAEGTNTVLIFDQFEEILTVDPTNIPAKLAFFSQLGQALRDRSRWALFALREDYLAGLDPYLRYVPTRFATHYRLDLLDVAGAREAMQLPARDHGVTFTIAAAQQLADNLRRVRIQRADGTLDERLGPYVEPVQLQVVCRRLWEQLPPGDTEITPGDLTAVGDVDEALQAYYDDQTRAVAIATGVGERVVRDWFDDQLITAQGIRGQVVQGPEESGGLKNVAVRQLVDSHLVRSEKRLGATWYELAHDRLIAPVQQSNAAWREANLTMLQRQAALWDAEGRSSGMLLRDAPLAEAEAWAQANVELLTESEHDFLAAAQEARRLAEREARQQRRIRALAVGASILSVIALVAAIVAANAWQHAVAARNEALAARDAAERVSRQARALQLAADAENSLVSDPQLSLLLAAQAVSTTFAAGEPVVPVAITALQAAAQEARLRRILPHPGPLVTVAFSPDGTKLATAGATGLITLWERTSATSQTLAGHSDEVLDLAFSPDGRRLASAGQDGSVRIWDITSRNELQMLIGHEERYVNEVAFSSDGSRLASAGGDGVVVIWDATSWQILWRLDHNTPDDSVFLTALAFSPDGTRVASAGSGDNQVIVWDLARGQPFRRLRLPPAATVRGLAFNPQNPNQLAGGGDDRIVRLWDLTVDDPPKALAGHSSNVLNVTFSSDGAFLASSSFDTTARIWSATRARPLIALGGHSDAIAGLAFSPDGSELATASLDATVRGWSLDLLNPAAVEYVAFQYASGQLLSFSSELHRWQAGSGQRVADGYDPGPLERLAASNDGTWLAATDADNRLRLWNDTSGQLAVDLPYDDVVDVLAVSPDGRYVATSGLDDWSIYLLDTASGARRQIASDHEEPITSLAFSPDGGLLASTSFDNRARIYTLDGSQPTRVLPHEDRILNAAFSPDNTRLAVVGNRGGVYLWEVAGARMLWRGGGHTNHVYAVAFSADGSKLATGGLDHSVLLWDAATGTRVQIYGLPAEVASLSFSDDGNLLAAGGSDGVVRVYPQQLRDLQQLAGQRLIRGPSVDECERFQLSTGCSGRP